MRGTATLLACWEAIARGAERAAVRRLPGAAVGVFPVEPERSVYNNAVLFAPEGVDAVEAAYGAAGISRYAAWAHETDTGIRHELEARGYVVAESTRAMAMALDDLRLPRPALELGPPDWATYVHLLGMPADYQRRADPADFHVLIGRLDGEDVAVGMAFEHHGDCGIFNVGTLEHARRRGLGTAMTAALLHDARERGCRTASLQSTPMAEGVYRAAGFRDRGLILEYGRPRV